MTTFQMAMSKMSRMIPNYFLLSLNLVPKIFSILEIRAGFGMAFPDSYS